MADNTTELEVLDEIVDVLGGTSGQYETVVPVLQQIKELLAAGITDPEAIAEAVAAWLDEHPEATTTVQDGSITDQKLVQTGGVLSRVAALESEVAPITVTNLLPNASFADATDITANSGTVTAADGIASISGNTASSALLQETYNAGSGNVAIKSGDVWYLQYDMAADFDATGLTIQTYPYARARANLPQGLTYFVDNQTITDHEWHTYYGNITITQSGTAATQAFQMGLQYPRTSVIFGSIRFRRCMLVNLTDVFGAGNEPTADEFRELLYSMPDRWVEGTAEVFSTKTLLEQAMTPTNGMLMADTVVTVGANGDFSSINDALTYLSRFYPLYKKGGIKCELRILAGTVITEQIYVTQMDLQHVTITAEIAQDQSNAVTTTPDSTTYTVGSVQVAPDLTWAVTADAHDSRGDLPFIAGENAAKLPTIGCVFVLGNNTSGKTICGLLANRGSECVVLGGCGFDGFYDGVISNNESTVTIREGISRNMTRWGVHARHNGEVSARSVIATGCGIAAEANRIADIDVREATLDGSTVAITASHASRITANGCHANGCGGGASPVVGSFDCSLVNCVDLEVKNATSNVFAVGYGGLLTAFNADSTGLGEGLSLYSMNVNTLGAAGIIFATA